MSYIMINKDELTAYDLADLKVFAESRKLNLVEDDSLQNELQHYKDEFVDVYNKCAVMQERIKELERRG
jgi:hypothetical protein